MQNGAEMGLQNLPYILTGFALYYTAALDYKGYCGHVWDRVYS